jgi:hypothetical protein
MLFEITGEVKQYRYRTARVRQHFLTLALETELELYHEELAAAAGVRIDNHVVYGITHDGNTVYIGFHDLRVTFGWAVDESS